MGLFTSLDYFILVLFSVFKLTALCKDTTPS